MSRRLLAWLPALAYMLLIWVLSSMPTQFKFEFVPFRDKGIHFVEYGTLAALLAHAMRGTWPEWRWTGVFLASWAVTTLWGLLDEIHQAFVPGRVADVRDLIADAIGGLLGAAIYLAVRSSQRGPQL
ncbi:MAG TPA: VanZ family protein [Polyangiales bacterium]|nr:VanZ family protein [Polyangiales bacterium]